MLSNTESILKLTLKKNNHFERYSQTDKKFFQMSSFRIQNYKHIANRKMLKLTSYPSSAELHLESNLPHLYSNVSNIPLLFCLTKAIK